MLPTRDSLQVEIQTHIESREMEKDIWCKWKWQESGVVKFVSDNIDFKTKTKINFKERQKIEPCIDKKIQSRRVSYAPNLGTSKHIKQILTDNRERSWP